MAFRRDSQAVGQVLTFLVAGVVFMVALGAVLLMSRGAGRDDQGATEATQQAQADRLADLLVNSQGIGWSGGADALGRLGVRATNGSGLQESSLEALRGGLFAHAANGKVDYPDARASLGLTAGQEFHLRMYPVGMESVYSAGGSGLRVGYIGDWANLPGITVALSTSAGEQVAAQAALNSTMASGTAAERLALRDLGLAFTDKVYLSTLSPAVTVDYPFPLPDLPLLTAIGQSSVAGDVYPDVKAYLDANLAGRIGQYDLLIVGSGVDQSALTAAVVKYAIRDWVQAGGTLIVLGSDKLNYQWLQPLFSTGIATANGAASAPDPSHPLLQEPHVLDWTHYNDHGLGWDIKAQDAAGFSDVIVKGGEDIVALSNDGALGAGRAILTTYMPREIAATLGQAEAEHFLENVVLFTDHSKLYLEYGPTQPTSVPIAVAVRQSYVYDETLGQVPVRLEIHYWGD